MRERGGGWNQRIAVVATVFTLASCGGRAAAPDASDAGTAALTTTVESSTTTLPPRTSDASTPAPTTSTAPVTTIAATTSPATTAAPPPSTMSATAAPSTASSTSAPPGPVGADLRIDEMVGTGGDAPGTAPWIHLESVKCAGPIGDWPITVSGVRDMGAFKFVVNGTGVATLAGTPAAASGTFTADYTLDVEGIPLSTGGEIAHIDGTATWANGLLTLEGSVTGTSHGENPYHQVMMSMIPSTQVMMLTPVAGSYC